MAAADRDDDDGDEILIIPDLEEEAEEDITTQVAQAPRNLTRRLPNLRDLDAELKGAVPSGFGVDLSVLTATLVPPDMVSEEDATWEFDALLQEVTQEFIADAERAAAMKATLEKQKAENPRRQRARRAAAARAARRSTRRSPRSGVKPQPKSNKNFDEDDDDRDAKSGRRRR